MLTSQPHTLRPKRPAKLKRKKSIKSGPKGGKFKRGNSAMGIVVAKEREVALKIRESSSKGTGTGTNAQK